jgi:hypothetical protein
VRRVHPNEVWTPPPAQELNAQNAAAEWVQAQQRGDRFDRVRGQVDPDRIRIANRTCEDFARWDVVELESPVLDPEDDLESWAGGQPAFFGVTPTGSHGRIAVIHEPAASCKFAGAILSGAVRCLVNVTEATHRFAQAVAGSRRLQSTDDTEAPCEILWTPPGETGVMFAVVRFSNSPASQPPTTTTTPDPYEEPECFGTCKWISNDGLTWTLSTSTCTQPTTTTTTGAPTTTTTPCCPELWPGAPLPTTTPAPPTTTSTAVPTTTLGPGTTTTICDCQQQGCDGEGDNVSLWLYRADTWVLCEHDCLSGYPIRPSGAGVECECTPSGCGTTTTTADPTTTTTTAEPTSTTTTAGPTTTTTAGPTTTTTPGCDCLYPAFCPTEVGECTFTDCSRNQNEEPDCTTTTTAGPTTCDCETLVCPESCTAGCDWAGVPDGSEWTWVLISNGCLPRCACPSPSGDPYCATAHTDCYIGPPPPPPPPPKPCQNRCKWVCVAAFGGWVKVYDGCTGTACACNPPSETCEGTECAETYTPCLGGAPGGSSPGTTTTSPFGYGGCVVTCCGTTTTGAPTTTTTTTANCETGGCFWRSAGAGIGWDKERDTCPDQCVCVPVGHFPTEDCQIVQSWCQITTTTAPPTTTWDPTTTTTGDPTTTTTGAPGACCCVSTGADCWGAESAEDCAAQCQAVGGGYSFYLGQTCAEITCSNTTTTGDVDPSTTTTLGCVGSCVYTCVDQGGGVYGWEINTGICDCTCYPPVIACGEGNAWVEENGTCE